MKKPLPLRLVMVTMIFSLTLLALDSASAAPSKKAPPAPVPVVETPPPAKRGFFQKLNPFGPKAAPPAPVPVRAPVKNSKKSAATVPLASPAAGPAKFPAKPLVRSTTTVKPIASTVAAPATVDETPKKSGFFARLKSKLDREPETYVVFEKPERPADWKERWVVTEESTAFYEFGPSQASGPDLRLPQGQVVKLASASGGWARVELEGGRLGYLGTDQIRQAAETDFAPPALAASSQLAATGGRTPQGWSPIAPPPDLPDLPMAAGMEDSLLLLPPLEFEGTELKKSSLRIPGLIPPDLKPGDPLPSSESEAPALNLSEPPAAAPEPAVPTTPANPPAPEAPAAEDAKPPAPETPSAPENPPAPAGPSPSV